MAIGDYFLENMATDSEEGKARENEFYLKVML